MKKKKKRGGSKRKLTAEQAVAYSAVNEWVLLGRHCRSHSPSSVDARFVPAPAFSFSDRPLFELHCHSVCSDGFLSPSKLVERAHTHGVKVLALTDHDTMSGIPEAMKAAHRFGIKIIPGVEISARFISRGDAKSEEPVHILAYYGGFGPTRFDDLEKCLASIRNGRFFRARSIVSKLNALKLPLKWEHVARIAGKDVSPGRLHIARALVEAGFVENLKQAFSRYLHDSGPAYSKGSEPSAEEVVQLISATGGVSVLAHPWALKNPISIIRRLKEVGLHGLEVYRSDGKLAAFSELADSYALLKLGGSDFHGRSGQRESELGSSNLPMVAVHAFLKLAQPIWSSAIQDILKSYAEEPTDAKLDQIVKFCKTRSCYNYKGGSAMSGKELIDSCLSAWLSVEERQTKEFEVLSLMLSKTSICQERPLAPRSAI